MRLKIKKGKKKIKIKTTKAKKKKNKKKKKKIVAKLGFEPRSLAWKARIISTRLLYHMASKDICKIFVQISVFRMGDQELKHITISSQLNFFNQQKGRGSLSVRKMNLRSHKTSVSIVSQVICTGNF